MKPTPTKPRAKKKKEPRLTLLQHRWLGVRIREVRGLLALFVSTRRNLPVERFMDQISDLKCELDEAVFQDFPEMEHVERCGVYYGPVTAKARLELAAAALKSKTERPQLYV